MFLIKMAVRNLARHKRRTIYTAIIISVAISFYVFADALVLGMMESSYENITEFEIGHIQIAHPEYWQDREDFPLDNLMYLEKEVQTEIEERPEVVGAALRLDFQAQISDGQAELPIIGRGIDPDLESETFIIEETLVAGDFIEPGQPQAVLGQQLAEDMLLEVGDMFMLIVRTRQEAFNVMDLTISGLVETTNPYVNENFVYVPLEFAQEALQVEDSYSHLALKLTDQERAESTAQQISVQLAEAGLDYQAYSWESGAEDLIMMQNYSDTMLILILGVILLLALAGIVNTVILSILERLKEIGMMKAMGMKVREITFVIALEAGAIGVIGGIIGCILGASAVYLLSTFGINIYAGMEGEFDLPISMAVIYGGWNPGAFIFVFFYSVIISFLAGLFPAYWGASKDPVDILQEK